MSTSVGEAHLDLGINYKNFNNQLNGISKNATGMLGGAFAKLGGIISAAFAVKGLITFSKSAITLASNLNEIQNVVDVTFGAMAGDINAFSKTALNAFGMSELSAKKYVSTMGAMLKSSGLTGNEVLTMSKSLTGLAGDLASFYNLSTEDAFLKLQSGISGEVEPLRRLGINLSQANIDAWALKQGLKGTMTSLDGAGQATRRYAYILSVTKDAQGDFVRTSGSWANQTRLLSEQWNIFKTTMGQGLINMLTPLLKVINAIIAKLQLMAEYFKAFTGYVFGSQQATSAAASSADDMTDATKGTGNAVKNTAKEVKKALAPFDQLNLLTKSTSDNLDDIASNTSPGAITPAPTVVPPDMNGIANAFDNIRSKVTSLVGNLTEEFSKIKKNFKIITDDTADIVSTALIAAEPNMRIAGKEFGEAATSMIQLQFKVMADTTDIAIASVAKTLEKNKETIKKDVADLSTNVSASLANAGKTANTSSKLMTAFWNETIGKPENKEKISSAFANVNSGLWNIFIPPVVAATGTMADFTASMANFMASKEVKDLLDQMAITVNKYVIPAFSDWSRMMEALGLLIRVETHPLIKSLSETMKVEFALGELVLKAIVKNFTDMLTILNNLDTILPKLFSNVLISSLRTTESLINNILKGISLITGKTYTFSLLPKDEVITPQPNSSLGIPKALQGNLPRLASGGLVSQPTMALVGDNRGASSDPEVISPLSKLQGMMGGANQEVVKVLSLILEALRSGNQQVVLKLNETEFGRAAITAINNTQRQAGKTLLVV